MLKALMEVVGASFIPRMKNAREARLLFEQYCREQQINSFPPEGMTENQHQTAWNSPLLAQAEEKYLLALADVEKAGKMNDIGTAKLQLALMYYHQGRFDEADAKARESIQTCEAMPLEDNYAQGNISNCHTILGLIALEKGEFETARKEVTISLDLDKLLEENISVQLDTMILEAISKQETEKPQK